MTNEPIARPFAAVLLYSGWQVWDGQYQPIRVGNDFIASVEFVQRSAPTVIDPATELHLEHTEANQYHATARVLQTTDAVVLDLGPFRVLRWVRPGESAGDFVDGDVLSLDLSLNLNAWEGADWVKDAADRHGTDHRWHVERIVRITDGRDDDTEIAEAAMETVDGVNVNQYCLLHCLLEG